MAAVMIETAYRPQFYQELPGIVESYQRLVFRDRVKCIETELRQLFLDHQVEDIFGVRLVHKHFQLRDDERMIQHGNTALPWDPEMAATLEADGVVMTASWLFRNGVAWPYEFYYVPHAQAEDTTKVQVEDYAEFFTAYQDYLLKKGLTDVLGVYLLQSEKRVGGEGAMLEINMDKSRASVNFPLTNQDDVEPLDIFQVDEGQDVTVPAGWFFFGTSKALVDGCGRHSQMDGCGRHAQMDGCGRHNKQVDGCGRHAPMDGCSSHKCRCRYEADPDTKDRYKTALWT